MICGYSAAWRRSRNVSSNAASGKAQLFRSAIPKTEGFFRSAIQSLSRMGVCGFCAFPDYRYSDRY
jgi:hypothetical protein